MRPSGHYRLMARRRARPGYVRPERFRRIHVEQLERRLMLAGDTVVIDDDSVVVKLDDVLDQFGFQAAIFQAYDSTPGNGFDDGLAGFSIFDTGASVITFAADDQLIFSLLGSGGIPIQVECGAVAEAVGGLSLVGHVSQRGTVLADGLHVSSLSFDEEGFPLFELGFHDPTMGTVADPLAGSDMAGDSALSSVNNAYAGHFLRFTTGALRGQVREIVQYVGASRRFTFAAPFVGEPVAGDRFVLVAPEAPFVSTAAQGVVDDTAPTDDRFLGDDELSSQDNFYEGMFLAFTSGPLTGQVQLIADYEGSNQTFFFADSFSSSPASGDSFEILRINTTPAAIAPGIQGFIGTHIADPPEGCLEPASPTLPTIAGTPMLNPSPQHPNGLAVNIRPFGAFLDFSEFEGFGGIVVPVPDVQFQDPGEGIPDDPACLINDGDTLRQICTDPMRIPLDFLGGFVDEDGTLTEAYNPVQHHITVRHTREDNGQVVELSDQTFLFDTGAQLSVITPDIAAEFGLDLSNPEDTISVQTAGGTIADLPGYRIDSITVPIEGGKTLTFENVWVFVVDAAEGLLDGIMGMNLFNLASSLVYDPWHPDGPVLELSYFTENFFSNGIAQVLEIETNNVAAEATPIRPGEYGAGSLATGDVDFWASPATRVGELVFAYVDTQASSTSKNARLVVRNKDENVIGSDEDDGPGPTPVVAGVAVANGQAGTVFYEVQPPAGESITEYAVYTSVVDPAEAVSESEIGTGQNDTRLTADLAVPGLMKGALGSAPGAGDVDFYEVTATEGARIVVMVDNDPDKNGSFASTVVTVLDQDGNVLFAPTSGDGDGNATAAGAVLGVPRSGRYLVRIAEGAPGGDNDYQFVTQLIDDGLGLLAANLVQTAQEKKQAAETIVEDFNEAVEDCGDDLFCLAETLAIYLGQLVDASASLVQSEAVLAFASTLTPGSMPTFVDVGNDLRVAIDSSSISENGGSTTAIVRRQGTDGDLTVNLTSSDLSEATVVATVVIPAGQRTSAPLAINAVDDTLLDGEQTVTISAAATGHGSGSSQLIVSDLEQLRVTIDEATIAEEGSGTGLVTRTDVTGNLTVTLSSSDIGEGVVPVSIVIPAGQASATFSIQAVDDGLPDGTQPVTISAGATGYEPGSDTVDIVEVEDDGVATQVELDGGNLVIAIPSDIPVGAPESLRVRVEGGQLIISDPFHLFQSAISGVTGVGSNDLTIPLTAITGNIVFQMAGTNNAVVLNSTVGALADRMSFQAPTGGNDRFKLEGGGILLHLNQFQGLDQLDLAGTGSNTLRVTLGSAQTNGAGTTVPLKIRMDSNDHFEIDSGWSIAGTTVESAVFYRILTQAGATIHLSGPNNWQNPLDPNDVSGDGRPVAFDVLLIVNQLNNPTVIDDFGKLVDPATLSTFPLRFYDVDGNGFCTSLDALRIVNFINRQLGPEGAAPERLARNEQAAADQSLIPLDGALAEIAESHVLGGPDSLSTDQRRPSAVNAGLPTAGQGQADDRRILVARRIDAAAETLVRGERRRGARSDASGNMERLSDSLESAIDNIARGILEDADRTR